MSSEDLIYLDSAATTRIRDDVLEEMLPFLCGTYGNPSSVHTMGREAKHAVETARERIAVVLHVENEEVLFTGSGTEANNMAVSVIRSPDMLCRLVTNPAEHASIIESAKRLSGDGFDVSMISPDRHGIIGAEVVREALDEQPALVSVMTVNNEIGTLNDVFSISDEVHAVGGLFHTDAVQAAPYYSLPQLSATCDLLTLSAHKIGGPKGIGLLFARNGVSLHALFDGGKQERGRRAGTENVAGIVGFARALETTASLRNHAADRTRKLRLELERLIMSGLGNSARVTTPPESARSAPHILHFIFSDARGHGLDGEMLVLGMDIAGIQASTGSACSSGAVEASHVLVSLGFSASEARGAIRLSLSDKLTDSDIRTAADRIINVVNRVGGVES